MNLHDTFNEVYDPVLGNARSRIQAPFVVAMEGEGGIGHLDNEDRRGRVSVAVVSKLARYNGDIGFRL